MRTFNSAIDPKLILCLLESGRPFENGYPSYLPRQIDAKEVRGSTSPQAEVISLLHRDLTSNANETSVQPSRDRPMAVAATAEAVAASMGVPFAPSPI